MDLLLEKAHFKITINTATTRKPDNEIKNKLLLIPPSNLIPFFLLYRGISVSGRAFGGAGFVTSC